MTFTLTSIYNTCIMAGPTKKAKKPAKPQSDSEYESDDSYNGPQEIQATFEGRNPESQDFHGIKQLLQQLFLKSHIDLGQMSDLLIAQTGVGSVLKQSSSDSEDDDESEENSDVYGITSVVNLTANKETPCIQQFYEWIDENTQKHSKPDIKVTVNDILEGSKLGLLINERFINIPSKISVAMLTSLQNELNRIKKKNNSYLFDYYVLVSKIWKSKEDKEDLIFSNDEEEIFSQKSDLFFEFTVANKSGTGTSGHWKTEDIELLPFRRVMFFKAEKLDGIIEEVANFIQNMI